MKPIIAVSILMADFSELKKEISMINKSDAQWIHIDVMDGIFVPSISFGVPVCEAISKHTVKPLDIHLMIIEPRKYLSAFVSAGASCISVHIEVSQHLYATISAIKDLGCKAGVAINPHTPVGQLEEIITELDYICLMGVSPGFGGQKLIEGTYEKVCKLKNLIEKKRTNTLIQVDGGVTKDNAIRLVKAGADILVAGSFVFKSKNPTKAITQLNQEAVNTLLV